MLFAVWIGKHGTAALRHDVTTFSAWCKFFVSVRKGAGLSSLQSRQCAQRRIWNNQYWRSKYRINNYSGYTMVCFELHASIHYVIIFLMSCMLMTKLMPWIYIIYSKSAEISVKLSLFGWPSFSSLKMCWHTLEWPCLPPVISCCRRWSTTPGNNLESDLSPRKWIHIILLWERWWWTQETSCCFMWGSQSYEPVTHLASWLYPFYFVRASAPDDGS